ncbi:helix-turn-helix domain-containing protein [Actinomadura fibrosa]|uniref:Helix-turn-helix domain-containing protein n=1 Tax=Actinomadura fibrosa TaxID=111802 RepID=A0ABW2XM19_9ACTN|nr:helix-turn-helix transcriptional regulator [Actinomadura fibrosa]
MAARKPSAELRVFGAEVTRHREAAGISRTELAERVHVTRSYVGQVEAGTTRCRREFAERLDSALGTGTALADAWDDLLRATGYPKWFRDFPKAEFTAAILRSYQSMLIDGLLQTEAYARTLLRDDAAVESRMRRQAVLEREPPPILYVVLDEPVLYRQVGSREVMREQFEHLLKVSERDDVYLQIAPTAYYRGVQGGFTIATQPDGEEIAYLANVTRGDTSSEAGDVVFLTGLFAMLQARAHSVDASRALIERTMSERWL